jgi:uncharacterized membrane protein YdfJ with MMPL/SSD domain
LDTKIIAPSPHGSPANLGSRRELPILRHYSWRRAWTFLVVWIVLAGIFSPLAYEFTNRIQSTLSGMAGSPPETVRLSLVDNFSTALAFPTALVWDARGVPPDQAAAAWSSLVDTVKNDPKVVSVSDGRTMIETWPRPDWYAAFVAVKARTYGEAQTIIPKLREDVRTLKWPAGTHAPWVTGGPALFLDLNTASTEALRSG